MNLLIALFTTHLSTQGLNDGLFDKNQIIAVQHDNVLAGTMINSYSKRSYIAAYDYQHNNWSGVYFGGATGYDRSIINIEGVAPVAAPYVKFGLFQMTLFGEAVALSVNIPTN